ncbi:MAG: WD40 repeat domain-containing protein [Candidatus Poribacteria bacterium]|nr:WD40 repeat domain-containing protein [Candidatus Poribacteria bacterium]
MSKLEHKIAIGIAAVLIAGAAALFLALRANDEGRPRLVLRGYPGHVRSLAFFPDSKTIAATGNAGVGLWDAESGQLLNIEASLNKYAGAVAVSPDGKKIALGGSRSDFVLWTISTGMMETYHVSRGESFYKAAFSPDGKTVAASVLENAACSIRIWDMETAALLHTLDEKAPIPIPFAYSPDSSQIAGGGLEVKIWDVKTGALLHTLKGHRYSVHSVAYSPDGKRLASASGDRTVKIWDAHTGSLLQTLKEHRERLRFAAYLPDGERVASGGADEIKIWDVKTGALLQTLKNRHGYIMDAATAVSSDGRFAAAAAVVSATGTAVLVWDIDEAPPAP